MPAAKLLWVMFEAFAELQFFQLAVVEAANEAEAETVLRAFLAKRGARFVEFDSSETRAVDQFPPAWARNAAPDERVHALSGRILVQPTQ